MTRYARAISAVADSDNNVFIAVIANDGSVWVRDLSDRTVSATWYRQPALPDTETPVPAK